MTLGFTNFTALCLSLSLEAIPVWWLHLTSTLSCFIASWTITGIIWAMCLTSLVLASSSVKMDAKRPDRKKVNYAHKAEIMVKIVENSTFLQQNSQRMSTYTGGMYRWKIHTYVCVHAYKFLLTRIQLNSSNWKSKEQLDGGVQNFWFIV